MRIERHPVLDDESKADRDEVTFYFNGNRLRGRNGETIAAALIANDVMVFRYSKKLHEPRGAFCCIGQCSECIVYVEGIGEVRSCITCLEPNMRIRIPDVLAKL